MTDSPVRRARFKSSISLRKLKVNKQNKLLYNMGTRSLTRVLDESGNTILTMYRQMDGYLEGHGAELISFLDGITLINGICLGSSSAKTANGMECLAAQLVAHFKLSVGSIYLKSQDADDEEYNYLIDVVDGQLTLSYSTVGHGADKGTLLPKQTVEETVTDEHETVVEFLYPTKDGYEDVWRKIKVASRDSVYISGYDLNDGEKFKRFLIHKIVGGESKIFAVNE